MTQAAIVQSIASAREAIGTRAAQHIDLCFRRMMSGRVTTRFVDVGSQVEAGEVITVEIKMVSGEWLELRGEVTSSQPGIGFGLVFSFLTDEEERSLQQLITS